LDGLAGLAVRDAEAMQGVVKTAWALLSLYTNTFLALQKCAEQPSAEVDAAQAWAAAKDLFVLLHEALPPLQASPRVLIDNLEQYGACLSDLTGTATSHNSCAEWSGRAHSARLGGYVTSHKTAEVLGSSAGNSQGACFQTRWTDAHRSEQRAWGAGATAASYEAMLVDFNVGALRLLKSMVYWALQFEAGTDVDSTHALSRYNLAPVMQSLMQLWCRPLPGVLKAEVVRVLDAFVEHSSSSGTDARGSRGVSARAPNFAAMCRDVFVARCLVPRISVAGPPETGLGVGAGRGAELRAGEGCSGEHAPSALVYELLLLDRKRARYEHSLAVLGLLKTLSGSAADALTVPEALRWDGWRGMGVEMSSCERRRMGSRGREGTGVETDGQEGPLARDWGGDESRGEETEGQYLRWSGALRAYSRSQQRDACACV